MDSTTLKPINEMTVIEMADYAAYRRELTQKAEQNRIIEMEKARKVVIGEILELARPLIPPTLHQLVSWDGIHSYGYWLSGEYFDRDYYGRLLIQVEGWAAVAVNISLECESAPLHGFQDELSAYGKQIQVVPYMGHHHDEAWIMVQEASGLANDDGDGWYIKTNLVPAQDFAEALDLARRAAPALAEMRAECDRRNTRLLDESSRAPKLVVPALSDVLAHYQGVRLTDQVVPLLGVIAEALITLTDTLQKGNA